MTNPRLSVLVNTYNHERFIAQAIRSVLDQDFSADQMEIIVVDDGSTDRTPEIVRPFLPRIRFIRKENGGQVSAFNVAVAETRGEIIAFLDGDDYWAKNKLSSVVAAFKKNPAIACVGHAYHEVDENGRITATMVPTGDRLSLETPRMAQLSSPLRVFLGTSRFAIRRAVLERALPVPADLPFFDNFIFSQAVAISGAILLFDPLCFYRLHSQNLYASSPSSRANGERLLWTKYKLLSALLEHLPPRLSRLGISDEVIAAFLDFDRVELRKLRLILEGGKRSETFQLERESFRLDYRNPDLGYRLFKYFALSLTILLPPRTFYRLRSWYGKHNLSSFRKYIGGAADTVPLVQRKTYGTEEIAVSSSESLPCEEKGETKVNRYTKRQSAKIN
jgi:glycosyltransferase involved in cell wall biosynthesis